MSSANLKLSVVVSTHQASFEALSFQGNVAESLAAVAAAGYDGAELAVRNAADVDGRELARLAMEQGLEIPAIGTGQMWGEERLSLTSAERLVRETTVERLGQHVELAAQLNATVIIGLVRGIFPAPELKDRSQEWLVSGLQAVANRAEAAGVRIALEAINRYETAFVNRVTDGLELIEQVSSSAVGLLLDTFHMNIEEPSMEQSIRLCGDNIFHFHVADSNRWYPGAGHIDFAAVLATLAGTGYTGYVSGEFLPLPDGPTSIKLGLDYLRAILAD